MSPLGLPSWRRHALTHAGSFWGVFDAGLSSLGTFLLGAAIARNSSVTEFGAFGVVFSIYLIVQGFGRTFYGQPQVLRQRADADDRRLPQHFFLLALAYSLSALVTLVVTAFFVLPDTIYAATLTLSICLPGLALQDAFRYSLFARQDAKSATLSDATWLIAQLVATGTLMAAGHATSHTLLLAWGITAWSGVLLNPRKWSWNFFTTLGTWSKQHLALSAVLSLEFVGQAAGTAAIPIAVSLVEGLAAAGTLRGGQLLFAPVVLISTGLTMTTIPQAMSLAHVPGRLLTLMVNQTKFVVLVTAVATARFFVYPDLWGE